MPATGACIAALHLYPVKSLRGLALDAAAVTPTGLESGGIGDREWMVVDPAGRFVTQRELPGLARIAPAIEGDGMVLRAAGDDELRIPLEAVPSAPRDVVVWLSHVKGYDQGDAAAAWLSKRLGRTLRLVRFDRATTRLCNPQFAGDSGAHTLFADGYPVLVIGAASLADLNARLVAGGSPALPMNRFRPNLVVDGLEPYDEDHLDTLSIGAAVLKMVKPCIRCQITTTDQDSAEVGIEPLPTLAGYRHDAPLGGVRFGMNAIVTSSPASTVRVGDAVEVAWRF